MSAALALLDLADRVEREDTSAKLDEDVALAMGWDNKAEVFWHAPTASDWQIGCPAFTSSIDAAELLRPKGWGIRGVQNFGGAWCYVFMRNGTDLFEAHADAITEPRARTAAALRATAVDMESCHA